MSSPTFNAKIVLNSSVPVVGVTGGFDVTFSVLDYEGIFDKDSLLINDYIFLDTGNLIPGSITRYKIISLSLSNTAARIVFYDTGDILDPEYSVGIDGFACSPSTLKRLAILPSLSIQQLPEKFGVYVKNAEYNTVFDVLDLPLSGGTMSGNIVLDNNRLVLKSVGGLSYGLSVDEDGALIVFPIP